MKKTTQDFLKLFFNEGEQICISPNKYGYHSVDQSVFNQENFQLTPPNNHDPITTNESEIQLVCINPVKGFRRDENVTSFRSFLMEIDDGSIQDQIKYVKESGLPYSISIFSGNKSVHYGIVLEEAFTNIDVWRFYNQWILNILTRMDGQNKNPTKSIRFPGVIRKDGKKLNQALIELKSKITQEQLFKWLFAHEDKKPIKKNDFLLKETIIGIPDHTKIPHKAKKVLDSGIDNNRNATWFYVGCCFADKGFPLDYTLEYLSGYFQEEGDFKQREFETCIKSAFKTVNKENVV